MSWLRKTRIGMFLAALILCTMCFSGNAFAVHTRVGVAAARSYVSSSYEGRVIIYAGDSRTMYMTADNLSSERKNAAFCWVNGGNISVISANGKLTPYLKNLIKRYRKHCVVVMNFGFNGNSNAAKNSRRVIKVYRRWMKDYPDVQFLVESVNPSGYSAGTYSNIKVDKLNKALKSEFQDQYMDISKKLLDSGAVTRAGKGLRDKRHYKTNVNKRIYRYIRAFIADYDFS